MKASRETQRGKERESVCVCERAQGCLRAGVTIPGDRRSDVVVCARPGQFKVGRLLVCFALPSVSWVLRNTCDCLQVAGGSKPDGVE